MCNLYNMTTNQEAIRRHFKVTRDNAGNMSTLPRRHCAGSSHDQRQTCVEHDAVGDAKPAAVRRNPNKHSQREVAALAAMDDTGKPLPCAVHQLSEYAPEKKSSDRQERHCMVCDQRCSPAIRVCGNLDRLEGHARHED